MDTLLYREREKAAGGRLQYARLDDPNRLLQLMQERQRGALVLARMARCNRSMIQHLRSGRRKTCTPALALALEEALGVPPGGLFTLRVSS